MRFSGSGGACDAASLASAYIVFMEHGKRKFVEKLDYVTSPGWLEGGESRHEAGFRRGGHHTGTGHGRGEHPDRDP